MLFSLNLGLSAPCDLINLELEQILSLCQPHRDFSDRRLTPSVLMSVQPDSFQNGGHVITLYVNSPANFAHTCITGERSGENESPG